MLINECLLLCAISFLSIINLELRVHVHLHSIGSYIERHKFTLLFILCGVRPFICLYVWD